MITIFAHLLFAAILGLSVTSHKHNDKNQGEPIQCQTLKKQ